MGSFNKSISLAAVAALVACGSVTGGDPPQDAGALDAGAPRPADAGDASAVDAADAAGLDASAPDASDADASSDAGTPAEVYEFDGLGAGLIHGKDRWVDQPGQGQGIVATAPNGTPGASHLPTVAFNEDAFLTRVNDGAFSFLPFTGTEVEAVLQMECDGNGRTLFALGADVDRDGQLSASERGPAFGISDQQYVVHQASGGPVRQVDFARGDARSDLYEVQLRIQFPAGAGDGVGSLWVRNKSDGETSFRLVSGLSSIPLGLHTLDVAAKPSRWNALWLDLVTVGDHSPHVDRLAPHLAPR